MGRAPKKRGLPLCVRVHARYEDFLSPLLDRIEMSVLRSMVLCKAHIDYETQSHRLKK